MARSRGSRRETSKARDRTGRKRYIVFAWEGPPRRRDAVRAALAGLAGTLLETDARGGIVRVEHHATAEARALLVAAGCVPVVTSGTVKQARARRSGLRSAEGNA